MLLVLILAPGVAPRAAAQSFLWTSQFGTASQDLVSDVAADASGVYVVGRTYGSLPDQIRLGGSDVFLRKYDLDGNEVWTRQFGTPDEDYPDAVASDASSVYVFGYTNGTLPGQATAGKDDAFLRKYDLDGNEVWTRQFGSPESEGIHGDVAVNASGVYVAGHTYGTLPGQTSAGDSDAFLRKYDTDGNVVWTRQFGTPDDDDACAVSIDAAGILVAGHTYGTLPGQASAGDSDAFLRKYDSFGIALWTRQFGTPVYDVAFAVAAGAPGIFVVGQTWGALPGGTNTGRSDAFLQGFGGDGSMTWTRQFGSNMDDAAYSLAVGASSVSVVGAAGAALPNRTSAGGIDAFLRKYDADGDENLTRQFGSTADDEALATDASGAFVGGWTYGTLPRQASWGGRDAFVASLIDVIGPPEDLRAAASDGRVVLTWDPPAPGGGALIAYRVDRGTDPWTLAPVAIVDAAIRRYADLDVVNGVTYHYRVTGTDGLSETLPATVSATPRAPPPLVITSPATPLTKDPEVTVAGTTASDATVAVDGSAVSVDPSGDFEVTVTLPDGAHTFVVVATDPLGQSTTARVAVTVDTVAPALQVTSPADGTATGEATVVVSGVTEPGARLEVNGLLVAIGPDGAFSVRVALAGGQNTITATATDAAGNVATTSLTVTQYHSDTDLTAVYAALIVGLVVVLAVLAATLFLMYRRLRREIRALEPPPPAK